MKLWHDEECKIIRVRDEKVNPNVPDPDLARITRFAGNPVHRRGKLGGRSRTSPDLESSGRGRRTSGGAEELEGGVEAAPARRWRAAAGSVAGDGAAPVEDLAGAGGAASRARERRGAAL